MSGLLKSDFYKLSKMKSFPICLLIVVALTVGSVFIQDYSAQFLGEGIVYNGSNQLLSTFAGDCKIFIAIVVSIFAASEFGFGTIKNIASRGFSRISIYFSKLIVSCFIALMIQLVYSIAYTSTATILMGVWRSIRQLLAGNPKNRRSGISFNLRLHRRVCDGRHADPSIRRCHRHQSLYYDAIYLPLCQSGANGSP